VFCVDSAALSEPEHERLTAVGHARFINYSLHARIRAIKKRNERKETAETPPPAPLLCGKRYLQGIFTTDDILEDTAIGVNSGGIDEPRLFSPAESQDELSRGGDPSRK